MKYYVSTKMLSVYWLEGDALMFTDINKGVFDLDQGAEIAEELIGDEYINEVEDVTFSQFYKEVRRKLKNARD